MARLTADETRSIQRSAPECAHWPTSIRWSILRCRSRDSRFHFLPWSASASHNHGLPAALGGILDKPIRLFLEAMFEGGAGNVPVLWTTRAVLKPRCLAV